MSRWPATGRLRHPLPWLLVLQALVFFQLSGSPKLNPKVVPDTAGYVKVAEAGSLAEALHSYRTLPYPYFLRFMNLLGDDFQWVPIVHLSIFFLGILLFWWGLRQWTSSPWGAFAGAAPLVLSPTLNLVSRIQSDMLAIGCSLATLGLLLVYCAEPDRRGSNPRLGLFLGLALALFCTYQLRPAYLFLLVFVPLAGPVLRLCKEPSVSRSSLKALGRFTVALIGLSLLPFLAFCSLRWAVADQFSLVSFGGFNLTGLSASMIEPELISELPPAQAELAQQVYDQRLAKGFRHLRPGNLTRKWYNQFNENVWQIAVPILEERLGNRDEAAPAINRELTAFSRAILIRRPGLYFQWIFDGFVYGVAGSLDAWQIVYPALLLFLSLPLLLLPSRTDDRPRWRFVGSFAFFAALYGAGALGLIVLVEVPFRRYLAAVALLVPSALGLALFEVFRSALSRFSGAMELLRTGKETPP